MSGKPSATLPGTVERIIKAAIPNAPDQAQITVDGADPFFREICIDNTLTNGNGDEVSLEAGARVEVILKADAKSTTPESKEAREYVSSTYTLP